jgi:hypothetical protein
MNAHRLLTRLTSGPLVSVCALLLRPAAAASAPPAAVPEGVVPNPALEAYSVSHVPKRSVDEVMQSFGRWRHQVLADGSSVDFSVSNGRLSMACSACGLASPASIALADINLDTLVGYEAGNWHIAMRTRDGSGDFFSVLRGELGAAAEARRAEDRKLALAALVDVYDLGYLTQNPDAVPPRGRAAKDETGSARPAATGPLEGLVAAGDVAGVQRLQGRISRTALQAALEGAYNARARAQMLGGQVDASLQTLAEGRKKLGGAVASLRDREAHYVNIGDAYDRLRLAITLEARQIQPYLRQLRADEPADANALEEMLTQALANRIADERASGRGEIADGLVSVGGQLFPEEADELTQGKAGVLDAQPGGG